MDLEQYRRESLANWDRLADNWASRRAYLWEATGVVGKRMVKRLAPEPGQTVLELAAGTGDTGFEAARLLVPGGRLISTDFSPEMVAHAERTGAEQGLDNVEHRVLDAERMDLDDASVDGVLCRWGYMLMADPAAALRETRRVLRPGGRLSFAVWGPPDRNDWAMAPGMVLVEAGHLPPPEPGTPGIFAMADPARIEQLVTEAGFDEPEIEQVEVRWGYADADEHWQLTLELAGPLSEAISKLEPQQVESVRLEVRKRIDPLLAEGGVTGQCHVITAS